MSSVDTNNIIFAGFFSGFWYRLSNWMASNSSGSKSSKSEIVAEMSSVNNIIEAAGARMMCCASCGKSEVDDIKLKKCDACDLVRYCGDTCKEDHRQEHAEKCKERAAILFRQPEGSCDGDCPICFLPLIFGESTLHSCCCKTVCDGCAYAYASLQRRENMKPSCPFCRHPPPKTEEEHEKNLMKRVEANDPVALRHMGWRHLQKAEYDAAREEEEYGAAFEYWTRAADLGDAEAHYQLAIMYQDGEYVENDVEKEMYHMVEAAIRGHPYARFMLAFTEGYHEGNIERAVKHFIIAAKLGDDDSIQELKKYYEDGLVSKEDFAAALRAHHAAVEATKSPQREAAAAEKAENTNIFL